VVLCDPGCSREKRRPSRHVDSERALWAAPLAGCAPIELVEHEAEVLRADNAEEVRVGYVAATRARDLLVVPCCGDEAVDGWVDVLHPALYPPSGKHRDAMAAPGCPAFGPDSVAERPFDAPPGNERAVAPGWHAIGDSHVVWWDPGVLALDSPPVGGVRQQDLLVIDREQGRDRAGMEEFERWRAGRESALAQGKTPSFSVTTVTRLAAQLAGAPTVEVAETAAAREERPHGRRFGTLVHAVLADVRFGAGGAETDRLVALHARLVGATAGENAAASRAVASALEHDIMARAAAAAESGRCFRELPLGYRDPSGPFVDGVADLAFCEGPAGGERWVVVDYKTDAHTGSSEAYRAQIHLYARALAHITGRPVTGILFAV
jgi:ATP-dependent helicase/nuclease subunit A